MKQTIYRVFTVGGAPVVIVFPAVTAMAIAASNVGVASGVSTTVLAASAARTYFEIFNPFASVVWINFGVAAAVNVGIPIQPGTSYAQSVENNFQIYQGSIDYFQSTGAGVIVPVSAGS